MPKRNVKLIVGLGNPGERFTGNRSNIGFKILDVLASNNDVDIRTKKKKSLIGNGFFEGKEIILLKPQTFSELSGEAVLYIASFLRIHPRNITIILDDINLPLGRLVVEQEGETDVHSAVPNMIQALKSNEFVRVRVGIRGHSYEEDEKDNYLKANFEPLENMQLINIINDTETAIRSIVHDEIEEVIEKYRL